MLIIKLFTVIGLLGSFSVFAAVLFKSYSQYSSYIAALDKNNFRLRKLLPFGLYFLDKYNYQYNSNYDRRVLSSISEVYGHEYSAFYIRVHYANKVILIALSIILQLFVGLTANFQAVYHAYSLLISGVLIIYDDIKLKDRVNKRRLEIQLEFPDFINKLILLLNAGLTMSKAWEKISADCQNKSDFYNEVQKTISEIKSGRNEAEAFGDFAKRVKTPEISRLMSTIVQNTKRGGNQLVLSLRLQSNECWEMRKNAVKRLGEQASTKLLFPMMIMFFAIIIIVVTPAIISMQGIN